MIISVIITCLNQIQIIFKLSYIHLHIEANGHFCAYINLRKFIGLFYIIFVGIWIQMEDVFMENMHAQEESKE